MEKDTPQSTENRAKPNGSRRMKKMLTDDHKVAHQRSMLTLLFTPKASSDLLLAPVGMVKGALAIFAFFPQGICDNDAALGAGYEAKQLLLTRSGCP